MSRLAKGYLIALIGITFWSLTGVFISFLIREYALPALQLAFWRNLLVCVALAPILAIRKRALLRLPPGQFTFFLVYGLLLALFNSIWVLSVQANGAAVATVLGYSSAGFTALLARWLYGEKLGLPKLAAVALSLTGLIMVSNAYSREMWQLNPLGVTTGLLTGLLFAGYNLFGKASAARRNDPWTALLYSFGFGTFFIILLSLLPLPGAVTSVAGIWPDLPPAGWLVLLTLAFVPTLLGFGLYTLSIHYLPVSIASLLATTEPVLTAIEAYVFLGERLTFVQIAGSLIILSAVLIVQLERERAPT